MFVLNFGANCTVTLLGCQNYDMQTLAWLDEHKVPRLKLLVLPVTCLVLMQNFFPCNVVSCYMYIKDLCVLLYLPSLFN